MSVWKKLIETTVGLGSKYLQKKLNPNTKLDHDEDYAVNAAVDDGTEHEGILDKLHELTPYLMAKAVGFVFDQADDSKKLLEMFKSADISEAEFHEAVRASRYLTNLGLKVKFKTAIAAGEADKVADSITT